MARAATTLHQAGVIAYRIVDGIVEVLLLTSRETRRWIIPKGNIGARSTPARAALREAYEEAGIKGRITGSVPLGLYTYFKVLKSGRRRPAAVEVYLLEVVALTPSWPERDERDLAWLPIAEAIRCAQEPGIVALLHRVGELEADLIDSGSPIPSGRNDTRFGSTIRTLPLR
jgi:8-oxo-dGTP pyrophosphatase MutT (NUDIX family)